MIRIYAQDELEFTSLGLGSLDEATAAVVAEELNGSYELELEYPITGRHFDKLQIRNIIFCKPNMYSAEQPFRIYSVTKPIDGRVTVNAAHISYDASGIVIKPKRNLETNEIVSFGEFSEVEQGYLLDSVLADINGSSVLINRFTLHKGIDKENVLKEDGYSIPQPMNLRSMLGGSDGSILDQYKGEYEFDKFDIYLRNKRGSDRGITIRYGKNLTDLEHESEGSKLYTGIFPFYSKRYSESVTNTKPIFQPAYIIADITPLRADWLSIEYIDTSSLLGGTPLNPVVETVNLIVDALGSLATYYVPVIVKTDAEGYESYLDKVYIFRKNTVAAGNLFDAYIDSVDEEGNITGLKDTLDGGNPIVPSFGNIYVIKDEDSDFYNKKIIYDNELFVVYERDGFYVEVIDARTVEDTQPFTQYQVPLTTTTILPTYKISWNGVEWEEDDINGHIYVYPIKPDVSTVSVDKYVYLDLLDCINTIEEGESIIFDNATGVLYINQELKDKEIQNILTLDMTSDLDAIGGLQPTDMTQETLFNKAEQYLKDNDFTLIKESITVSFIQLSNSPEYEQFKDLEVVQLGDEITVIYESLGVNTKRRVIYTEYDVLTNSYSEIELGDKTNTITSNIVSTGDNISSLKNDADYANRQYIVELIAENANIINAEIQNAIIKTLEVSKINVSGLLEASSGSIDQLVAKMFTADNAAIADALLAGTIRVKGDFTMDSGSITINKVASTEYTLAYVLENNPFMGKDWLSLNGIPVPGWVYISYSSSELIGDENVDGSLLVDGLEEAQAYIDSNYPANGYGYGDTLVILDSNGVYIQFECQPVGGEPLDPTAYPEGTIFKIASEGYYYDKRYKWNFTLNTYKLVSTYVFTVDKDGNVIANSLTITGGSIQIGDNFYVNNDGILTAKGVKVIDGEISIQDKFKVDAAGNVEAKSVTIEEVYAEKIDSDEVKSNDVIVDRLYLLNDRNVYIERVTEDDTQSESQVVVATAGALGFQDGNQLYISAQVTTNYALFETKNFLVTVKYRDMYNNIYTYELTITIVAGESSGSAGDVIPVSGMQQYSVDNLATAFPARYTESRITGGVTNKVVLHIYTETYDIVTGISMGGVLSFIASEDAPDTTNLADQSLWFDID